MDKTILDLANTATAIYPSDLLYVASNVSGAYADYKISPDTLRSGLLTESNAASTYLTVSNAVSATIKQIGLTIDGGGSTITTGVKGYFACNYGGTIKSWTLLSDVVSDLVIDIWKDTYANYPPTNTDSITNGHEPVLVGAIKNKDVDLSDWTTTTITSGDVIGYNVDSVANCGSCTLIIEVEVL